MNIPRLSQLTTDLDREQRATARLAAAVSTSFLADDPVDDMIARGHRRFKSAVAPLLSTDADIGMAGLDDAFLALADEHSALGALLQHGAQQFGLRAVGRLLLAVPPAAVVPEGGTKPVQRVDFAVIGPPVKSAAQVVLSTEFVRATDATTQRGVRNALVVACRRATDTALVAALTAGTPLTAGATLGEVLAALSDGNATAPAILASYDTLLAWPPGTLADLEGMNIAVVPTPAATGKLIGVDCIGVAIADSGVEIALAKDALVEMDDAPPAGGTIINLWQQNYVSLRVERMIRVGVHPRMVAWAATT